MISEGFDRYGQKRFFNFGFWIADLNTGFRVQRSEVQGYSTDALGPRLDAF
jgi:hypothetical protein